MHNFKMNDFAFIALGIEHATGLGSFSSNVQQSLQKCKNVNFWAVNQMMNVQLNKLFE